MRHPVADSGRQSAPARSWPDVAAPLLRARALPAWPFATLFVLYPVWWVLGLTPVVLPLLGAVCLFLMVLRGSIRLPPLWFLWVSFLIWAGASSVMVDSPGRLVGFAQRLGALLGASLLVVYLYNARERLPRRRAVAAMSFFGVWLIVGGYLGMAFPHFRLRTPMLALAPTSLATNDYVIELLSPRFAEVQHPYGATSDFIRPSAPFPYTNAWGHTFVLLLPIVAALAVRASRRTQWLLAAGVAVAIPPALATLNRGIFVGVAVAAGYLMLRTIRRMSHLGAADRDDARRPGRGAVGQRRPRSGHRTHQHLLDHPGPGEPVPRVVRAHPGLTLARLEDLPSATLDVWLVSGALLVPDVLARVHRPGPVPGHHLGPGVGHPPGRGHRGRCCTPSWW